MKFLIIIPAHNEEKNIVFTLKSLKSQTFQNFHCVIVNDGSTDKTLSVVQKFIEDDNFLKFKILNLPKSSHEPGAKVVKTFNEGLKSAQLNHYQIFCKFDADIVFPQDYLEKINDVYEKNPKAGMVSGIVCIQKNKNEEEFATHKLYNFTTSDGWIFENLSSKNHVRGPIKSYRKECFFAMNGLRPVLGWDNIDVMLAQKNGWEILTIKDLWVKHLRPTAYLYKKQKAEKLGEYFYNIGLSFPLAAISSAKSSFKNKSILELFVTMKSFLKQNSERNLTKEEIIFIRKLRWNAIFNKKI